MIKMYQIDHKSIKSEIEMDQTNKWSIKPEIFINEWLKCIKLIINR